MIHMSHSPSGQPEQNNEDNQSSTSPQTSSQRRVVKITSPEVGSLLDIMHANAGKALYVLPICWTDLHIKLLGARFQELPVVDKPVPEYIPGRWIEPSKIARAITVDLHALIQRNMPPANITLQKGRAIKFVMSTLFPQTLSRPKTGAELDLRFGGRNFKKTIRVLCMWKSPSSSDTSFDSAPTMSFPEFATEPMTEFTPNRPMLAYVSRSQLSMIRKNLFRVVLGPNNTPNAPVSRLQRLRSNLLIPANTNHDAYIVAILIAMAQSHFYPKSSSRSSSQSSSDSGSGLKPPSDFEPNFRDIKVQVITNDEGDQSTPNFIIYTATVSATFLGRFHNPHKAPQSKEGAEADGGLNITHTSVPFWPILGLKERLAKALGRDVGGDPLFADPDYIALWHPLVEQPRPSYSVVTAKRRRHDREPRSEMLNSSFEDEGASSSEDEAVMSPAAKRRRTNRTVNPLEVC